MIVLIAAGVLAMQVGDSVHVPVKAAPLPTASLTVTPITWNVIGLDSNNPATGPNRFPVGARVCNTGGTNLTGVTALFSWDSANAYVSLRSGSLSSISMPTIGVGSCSDAYFEVEVDKTSGSAPFNTARRFHITATDSVSGATGATPLAREMYVEHLISQNRNGVTSIKLNGTAIPAGGGMTLVVGNTYTIELAGYTATQGYNQLEGFINFPNTIFQTLAVSTTYTADSSVYVTSPSDKLYANGCLWEDDPNSPNYRSCIGGDGKGGGTVVSTYTVRILSGGGTSQSLESLLYDFSGSSYHYNADYSVAARIANIVSPASVSMTKTFTPRAITPGGTSAMIFKLTNPTSEAFTGVNFSDSFPASLKVAATPGVTYSGCGAGAFSPVPAANDTSLSFAGGTLSANSTCTISVNVTAPAGTYTNTTGHLYINTTTDTGNFGQDTLTVAAAAVCTPGQTLARWTVPTGTVANPPDTAGGLPTTKSSRVSTATAVASVPANSAISTTLGQGDTTSWETFGYKNAGQNIQFAIDTSKFSDVSMSFYVGNPGGANGPNSLVLSYSTGGAFTNILTIPTPASAFTLHTQDFAGLTNTGGITTFKLTGTGANNDQTGANLNYDNISFAGCGLPSPPPTIAKSFSPKPIVKGAASTLTFTLNNTAIGNAALTGVAFTDVLPAGLSIASSSSSHCSGTVTTTAGTRTIALTGAQIAAGGTCTFNVSVTGTTEGAYDNITGYVSSAESGTSANYATDSLTVIAPPTIGKSFSPASVVTGGTSTLSFKIANPNSLSSLSGLGFTDTLPAGLTVASSGPTSTCGGSLTTTSPSTITFSGGSLAANGSCTFSVTVTGATAGSKVNTTSAITSTEGGNGTAATATLVVNSPAAVIDLTKQISTDNANWYKFVGSPIGGSLYYRFKVYNGGDVPFTAISVTDPTLAGTAADPAACIWAVPLATGDTAFCVKGPVAAVSGTHINTASASGTYASGTANSANSTASYSTTALTIAKSATESYFLAAGNVLHYSYLVTNSGFAPLIGPVTVADDRSTDETCPAVSTVGDLDDYLDPGESITCTATYAVLAVDVTAGYVTNTASATVSGVTSNTATKTVNLGADLSISKSSAPKPYVAGSAMTYTIIVTNHGPNAAVGARVTDTLPAALSAFAWTCSAAGGGALCGTPGPVTGNIDALVDLPVGTQAIFTVTGTVPGGTTGTLTNTATVAAPTGITDPILGNNTSTDINPVATQADLAITKTSSPKPYAAGSAMTYTITVTNKGPSTVTGATVSDTIPSGLTGVTWTSSTTGTASATSGGTGSGNNLAATVNITSGAGNSVIFSVTGTVATGTTGAITNTAIVTPPAGTTDPVSGNNAATDVNPTGTQADLAITKSSAPNPYVANSALTYTITVTNNGPAAANNSRVLDALPSALSGFSWTCAANGGGTCLQAGGTGNIDALVSLPSGGQAVFTVTGTVPSGTTGALANTATVIPPDGTTDPIPGNNNASDSNPTLVTAAGVSVSGRVLMSAGNGLRNATVTLTDPRGVSRTALSSAFGYFHFDDVQAGETYVVSVTSKRFHFLPRVVNIMDELNELNLIAEP